MADRQNASSESIDAPLIITVKTGDLIRVRDRLRRAREDLNPQQFTELVRYKDLSGMNALHHAAWDGHVDIVLELLCHIDVNSSTNSGFTSLHLASWNNRVEVVERLIVLPNIDLLSRSGQALLRLSGLQNEIARRDWPLELTSDHFRGLGLSFRGPAENSPFLYPEMYNKRVTALHIAALAGHTEIVEAFVRKLPPGSKAFKALNAVDDQFMTPLHYAIIGGDASIVAEFLSGSTVRANLEELCKNLTPLETAFILIHQAQDRPDVVHEFNLMISMLLERPEVKGLMENLYSDRQVFVDAANAILVGAALIASITFAGWLQPPLGYQPYYETKYLQTGLAPPDTFQAYAAVRQHASVQAFWVFNSLSFFFAIATVLTGAGAVLPSQETIGKDEVEHIRKLLIRTSMVLSLSVFFVLGAFMAAGLASLPPTLKYRWSMILTSALGGAMCIFVLFYYYRRIFRLFRFRDVPGGVLGGVPGVVPNGVSGGVSGSSSKAVSGGFSKDVPRSVSGRIPRVNPEGVPEAFPSAIPGADRQDFPGHHNNLSERGSGAISGASSWRILGAGSWRFSAPVSEGRFRGGMPRTVPGVVPRAVSGGFPGLVLGSFTTKASYVWHELFDHDSTTPRYR